MATQDGTTPKPRLDEGIAASDIPDGAMIEGQSIADVWSEIAALIVFGIVLIPGSIVTFDVAEKWAKKTGRLKRQG